MRAHQFSWIAPSLLLFAVWAGCANGDSTDGAAVDDDAGASIDSSTAHTDSGHSDSGSKTDSGVHADSGKSDGATTTTDTGVSVPDTGTTVVTTGDCDPSNSTYSIELIALLLGSSPPASCNPGTCNTGECCYSVPSAGGYCLPE